MRKCAFLALSLVVALILSTSCSLIAKDPEVDKSTVIIEVAGKTFTKEEVLVQVESSLNYQEQFYTRYGMAFDRTDPEVIASVRETVIESMIEQAVVEQKVGEYNLATISDEDQAAVQAEADTTYQTEIDSIKAEYFADTELEGEALETAVADMMVELGYYTKEAYVEVLAKNKAIENLEAEVVKDVIVTEEEIQAEYDTRVETAKTNYASSLGSYGVSISNGSTVYYTPAGYRYVKHILRNISSEDSAAITAIQTQITSKQSELTTNQTALTSLGEDATADDEATAALRTDYNAAIEILNTEIADLNTQLDAAKETAYAAIQPMVDEIQAKIDAGEDFDALIEEYGEDPGMKVSPAKENGYLVCEGSTNWVTEFTSASMALNAIGDVAPAVRTSYGIHIIKYVSDVEEGAIPLDTVKDVISSELLATKQDALYTETVAQWVADSDAKSYPDRLAD